MKKGRFFSVNDSLCTLCALAIAIAIAATLVAPTTRASTENKILPPPSGAYIGAYANFGPIEEDVSADKIHAFEVLSGKKLAWAYFSDNWLKGEIIFPQANFEACRAAHVVPYIRLSPWSEMIDKHADKIFSMQKVIDGRFDAALKIWAQNARDFGDPIMIEFGPEVNGDWFPWNGRWNGGATVDSYGDHALADGPERFRDAYRHLIDLFRHEGAMNITWILHVDSAGSPEAKWNFVKNYYPGDDYIDWIGVSVFGRQLPKNDWILFPTLLKAFMSQVLEATSTKPILISEFGVIEDATDANRKAIWLHQAFSSISKGMFKNVKGLTYWNSPGWLADRRADFSINSSPLALEAFRSEIASPFWISDLETTLNPTLNPTLTTTLTTALTTALTTTLKTTVESPLESHQQIMK